MGIHMTSSVHSIGGGGGGMASAPVATMGSVSSTRGISSNVACGTGGASISTMATITRVSGSIHTSASSINGGVTTYDNSGTSYSPGRGIRRTPGHEGDADEDDCPGCVDEDDDGVCDVCGHALDDCDCEEEHDYCRCPVELDWSALMFLSVMALGYVFTKTRYNIFARAYNRLK